jgi:hypothetical protein
MIIIINSFFILFTDYLENARMHIIRGRLMQACEKCPSFFEKHEDLQEHTELIHSKESQCFEKCVACNIVCTSLYYKQKHIEKSPECKNFTYVNICNIIMNESYPNYIFHRSVNPADVCITCRSVIGSSLDSYMHRTACQRKPHFYARCVTTHRKQLEEIRKDPCPRCGHSTCRDNNCLLLGLGFDQHFKSVGENLFRCRKCSENFGKL